MSLDIKVTRKKKISPDPEQIKADISGRSGFSLPSSEKKVTNNNSKNTKNINKKYIWWLIFIILLVVFGLLIMVIVKDSSLLKNDKKYSEIKFLLEKRDSESVIIEDNEVSLVETEQNLTEEIDLDVLIEDLNSLDLELEAFDQFNTIELESMQNILLELK